MSPPKYYTTFQAAKLLGVSLATVVNWTRDGMLQAHRTPGGHRRISEPDLIAFARAYKIPLADGLADQVSTKRRVLIVDDDTDYLTIVKTVLERNDFEVETARSGFGAGVAVERFRPDVILMDIRMPGMDGFEVMEKLEGMRAGRPVPVIGCSGTSDEATRRRIERVFDRFLPKPFDYGTLLSTLDEVLA